MNNYYKKDEILLSWRRCIENNILTQKKVTVNNLVGKEIKKLLDKNEILVSAFEEALKNIKSKNICKSLFLYYQMLTK